MVISRTIAAWVIAGAIAMAASTAPSFAQGRGQGQGQGQGRGGGQSSQPPKGGKATTPRTQPSAHAKSPVMVHPPLARNLQPLLPGVDLNVASVGFRNLGQFVAAVHVSNNLGIPFTELKNRMVTQNRSLGQSIQELRPKANASAEASRAERQARATMDRSGK